MRALSVLRLNLEWKPFSAKIADSYRKAEGYRIAKR
jgi:hypothetical protein